MHIDQSNDYYKFSSVDSHIRWTIINRNGNVIYVQSGNEALARTGNDGIICYVYCVSNNKTVHVI